MLTAFILLEIVIILCNAVLEDLQVHWWSSSVTRLVESWAECKCMIGKTELQQTARVLNPWAVCFSEHASSSPVARQKFSHGNESESLIKRLNSHQGKKLNELTPVHSSMQHSKQSLQSSFLTPPPIVSLHSNSRLCSPVFKHCTTFKSIILSQGTYSGCAFSFSISMHIVIFHAWKRPQCSL